MGGGCSDNGKTHLSKPIQHNRTSPILRSCCKDKLGKSWFLNLLFSMYSSWRILLRRQHWAWCSTTTLSLTQFHFLWFSFSAIIYSLSLISSDFLSGSLLPLSPLPSSLPSLAINEWTMCSLNMTLGNRIACCQLNRVEHHNEKEKRSNRTHSFFILKRGAAHKLSSLWFSLSANLTVP